MPRSKSKLVQVGVLGVASLTFLILTLRQSQNLYFVWEEWTQLLDATDTPLWGVLQSHFGYVAPLSRLVFALEAKLFGGWYTGYVAVNSILLIAFVWLVWKLLPIRTRSAQWLLLGGLITFMFSAGTFFASSFAAMNGYFMCWILAFLVVALAIKDRWYLAAGAMLLSALSNNLMNVTVTFTAVAVLLAVHVSHRNRKTRILTLGVLSLIVSGFLFFIGRFFPAADTAIGTTQSLAIPDTTNWLSQVELFFSVTAVWLGAPFVPLVAINQSLYQRCVIFLMDYGFVLVIGLTALFFVWYLAKRDGGRPNFLWLLLPIAAFAAQVTIFRGSQAFEGRYTLMWLPPVIIFWALWLDQMRGLKPIRVIAVAAASLTAGLAVLASPQFISQSVDLIRDRTIYSDQLRAELENCDSRNNSTALNELAPSMTWAEVCRANGFLR